MPPYKLAVRTVLCMSESDIMLKQKLLELLEKDPEFRYAVAGLIGFKEVLDRLSKHDEKFNKIEERILKVEERLEKIEEEIKKIYERLEDYDKKFNEILRRLEIHDKILEEHSRRIEELAKRIEDLAKSIQALGMRWGLVSEEAFRRGMYGIVEKILGVGRVERWTYVDREGFVYGYPSLIDVDLVIKDSEHILVEIKASVSAGDVLEFKRIGELYEKVTGKKPKLVIVTLYAHEKAKEVARVLEVEIYEGVSGY